MKKIKGIINQGNPNHTHHLMIRRESHYNGHQIGRCGCGRVIDYTVAMGGRILKQDTKELIRV